MALGLATALALTAACDSGASASTRATGQAPVAGDGGTVPAAGFTDSVGVNAHWTYLDTPYGSRYGDVRRLLLDSGIKHVRSDATRASDLSRDGITTTVLVDLDAKGRGDPATQVARLAPLAASGAVDAVEGPNEPDVFWTRGGWKYRGRAFPEGVLAWQRDLYDAVNSDPRTAALTVIGPALGGTYWGGGQPFRPGALEASSDWGNFHPYAAGNPYTQQYRYAGIDQYYRYSDFPSIALDEHPISFTTYQPPFGSDPMAASELGYSTWEYGQSEVVQGRYLPRMFLEDYRLGIRRSYSYELVDAFADPTGTNDQAHYGLLRHDLTPKPAYYAVRSLLSALSDRGAEPSAGASSARFDYELNVKAPTGYDASSLHHIAFQKSDGTVIIALWNEISADDLSGLDAHPKQPVRQVQQPDYPVELDLGDGASGVTVRTIDDAGKLRAAPVQHSGGSYAFSVPDRVTLVTVPGKR